MFPWIRQSLIMTSCIQPGKQNREAPWKKVRTQALSKSAVMPSMQCNPSLTLRIEDRSVTGQGVCWGDYNIWILQYVPLEELTVSQLSNNPLSVHSRCSFPLLFVSSSILYPCPSGPCENSQLPEPQKVLTVGHKHGICKTNDVLTRAMLKCD